MVATVHSEHGRALGIRGRRGAHAGVRAGKREHVDELGRLASWSAPPYERHHH